MKRRDVYLKLTRHNGRAGTHGTYNPKHNDRSFNLANSEHIDPERAKGNIYWDCFHGFRSALDPQDPDDLAATFSEVERQFYESRYSNFVESQNERNAKIRHTERNRSIPDLLSSRKTCPEETIYQLGTLDEHASAEDLLNIVTEFIDEFKTKFGDHVHVLDWALHLDESTPHIHERHVFDCENQYGEIAPQQEKALEALGFDLPDPDKPLSRRNNRKIAFDAACRKMLFEIAKRHGLDLEEEAEYGSRKYLEKQDFILAKQKEQLSAQQNKLDELTLKVSDMETLLEDVSAAAYDKAVEVMTDAVRTETRKEDMRMIEDTKRWVLSPERKAPQATREYTAKHLDESTPHIHERHVFDCENKHGEVAPQQEKALEALGFDLPDPDKPLSRRNNRKITFDAACRKMLFEIAKRHGLDLEEEAEYGNRKYLEKQDFILAKQKEQLAAQQDRLDELTLKVSDMETLLDDVSAAAYDKAVEVVTEVVRTETRKEDMRMIEDTKKWVLSPERKAPKATREYTAKHLDTVLDKFLKTMQTTAARLQEKLLKPEVRQKGKEQVKEKARDSVLQLLSRLQAEQAQRKPSALPAVEKSENRFQS